MFHGVRIQPPRTDFLWNIGESREHPARLDLFDDSGADARRRIPVVRLHIGFKLSRPVILAPK